MWDHSSEDPVLPSDLGTSPLLTKVNTPTEKPNGYIIPLLCPFIKYNCLPVLLIQSNSACEDLKDRIQEMSQIQVC